jgi:transcriptional regulator with XRE-family HTH domain
MEAIRSIADRQGPFCNIADLSLLCGVQTFGSFLTEALTAARMEKTDFARRAKISKQFVSDLVRDRRTPPLEDVEKWSEILGLRGAARERFQDLAVIAHIPAVGRSRFLRFLELVDQYQRDDDDDER